MTAGEVVTDTGAIAAIASPWWLSSLHTISEDAALLLPVFGVIWLAVQIIVRIHTAYRKNRPLP